MLQCVNLNLTPVFISIFAVNTPHFVAVMLRHMLRGFEAPFFEDFIVIRQDAASRGCFCRW
jgi:hypothetical protein